METPENTPKKSSWSPNNNVGTPAQPTEREKHLPTTPQTPNRIVGSLVLLTQKFVDLMIKNGGEIDLRDVSSHRCKAKKPPLKPWLFLYSTYLCKCY